MRSSWFNDPFSKAPRALWRPRAMTVPPFLDPTLPSSPVKRSLALLINPFYPKDPHCSFGKHVLTPTLALTSLMAVTPSHWRTIYWDENLLQGRPPWKPMPEVVGITVHLTFAKRAYELAAWYRQRGARVILGGPHVQSCPEEAAPHADVLAIGNGVQLWPAILLDVETGNLKPVYRASFHQPYREEATPPRHSLSRRSFLTTTSLIATRGCHNRCEFCHLSTEGLQMPYQTRDAERVAREFEADGQPYGVFTDNNLGSNRAYLHKLCHALKPLKKIWSAAVSLDVTDDPSVVREMALAGCSGVFIGFESLSDENLAGARKRTPRTHDFARRIAIFHDHGIQVNGSFVLGFDGDRKDVFLSTAQWIEENRLECATFHILTPYPGTPLFRRMEAEGRLLHKNWNLYDTAHAVFRPVHMRPEELEQGYGWLYRRLFSHTSIWRRRPQRANAVLPYLAMAYLYKRSNRFWHFLIRWNLTHAIWWPLVELSRRRHLRFRKQLEGEEETVHGVPLPVGVA